jgi:hypothetical protein
MLVTLTLLSMLIVSYCYWREGILTACCMCVNVLLSGLITFSVWEPAANLLEDMFRDTFLAGYEDFLCLVLIFSLSLGLLRSAVNSLAFTQPDYPPMLLTLGGAFFGLITGYLAAGFLVCAMQTLPLPEDFLDARVEEGQGGMRHYLPPDRVWLAMMHRAGEETLSWGEKDPTKPDYRPTFDPHGNFSLRYARYRRAVDKAGQPFKYDGILPAR